MIWEKSAYQPWHPMPIFQQNISNLNVISNVKGIVAGTGLDGGNIEFWPNNYAPANSSKVPSVKMTKNTILAINPLIPSMAMAACRCITTTPNKRFFPSITGSKATMPTSAWATAHPANPIGPSPKMPVPTASNGYAFWYSSCSASTSSPPFLAPPASPGRRAGQLVVGPPGAPAAPASAVAL